MTGSENTTLRRTGAPDLLVRRWPRPEPTARLLLVHGFAEHSGRYDHVAAALLACGIDVTAFDLRGHGESGGTRAFVERFDDYLDDVDAALGTITGQRGAEPLFLLGHSMGGLVAALHVLDRPTGIDGLVMSSPCFGFAVRVPGWKSTAARVCSRLLPRLSLPSGLDRDLLSHDPEIQRALRQDPHSLTNATARWYTETLAAQRRGLARAGDLRLPLLCQAAGIDGVVDAEQGRRFFDAAGSTDKQWLDYDGLYHEIYNELQRDRVLQDLTTWLEARVTAPR